MKWSDGTELIPHMSFRGYKIIKDGVEIESMYADISQVRPRADELHATQIYDGGEFRMTSYGIGNMPKEYKSIYDLQKENQKEFESVQNKNIKLWYSDNGENGILFTILKFDSDLKCEECDHIGSWYMINEKYKIGACSYHCEINGNIGEGKLWKKKEFTDSDSLEGINPCEHCLTRLHDGVINEVKPASKFSKYQKIPLCTECYKEYEENQ